MQALLVSSGEKGRAMLTELMRSAGPFDFTVAGSGSEARRLSAEMEYDLIVINAPLSDEYGDGLSMTLAMDTSSGILLLVRAENEDEVSSKVEDMGVMVLGKPLGRAMFYQALKMVTAAHRRMMGLKSENLQLQKKIDEIRLVDRAKCALIQYLSMTEAQAHRYIEKQAMDRRTTRGRVAQSIIEIYEQ